MINFIKMTFIKVANIANRKTYKNINFRIDEKLPPGLFCVKFN